MHHQRDLVSQRPRLKRTVAIRHTRPGPVIPHHSVRTRERAQERPAALIGEVRLEISDPPRRQHQHRPRPDRRCRDSRPACRNILNSATTRSSHSSHDCMRKYPLSGQAGPGCRAAARSPGCSRPKWWRRQPARSPRARGSHRQSSSRCRDHASTQTGPTSARTRATAPRSAPHAPPPPAMRGAAPAAPATLRHAHKRSWTPRRAEVCRRCRFRDRRS